MRLAWTPLATADIEALVRYIARDDLAAAFRTQDRIERRVGRLAALPNLGRPGRQAATRELVIPATPYLVVYRLIDDRVEILRVLHGAREWPPR
jgi:toxin ParE1/3/4